MIYSNFRSKKKSMEKKISGFGSSFRKIRGAFQTQTVDGRLDALDLCEEPNFVS